MSDAVERYVIRANREWAFIYVDEQYGVFTCYSSYGNYAYCWRHIGEQTLKKFLAGLNFSYFMGKTRRDYLRFDPEATVDGIKTYIIEQRRAGDCDRSGARGAWEDAEELLCHSDSNEFFSELCASKTLMDIYGGDYCDIARERPDGDSRGFWEKIWPEFLKRITTPAEEVAA